MSNFYFGPNRDDPASKFYRDYFMPKRAHIPVPAQMLKRYVLLGTRWNGRICKLFESSSELLAKEARLRRLATKHWQYLVIIPLDCPRPFDTKFCFQRTP